jgi:HPt (histidine-containing phosphotransfer) domain-containing protein
MGGADVVRRAAALGCRHYLVKPIQRWTLRQKVAEALGDKRPVIMERDAVMQKFGLDAAAYDRIYELFKTLVAEQIVLLDKKINHPGGMPSIIDLSKLVEEASILGAERLAKVAERLQAEKAAQSMLSGKQYVPLFEELKLVADQMSLPQSSEVSAA